MTRPFAAVVLLFFALVPAHSQNPVPADFRGLWQSVHQRSEGEGPRLDDSISWACTKRAAEMAAEGVLSHVDADGHHPGDQMLLLGGKPGEWGEILGAGPNLDAIFAAWSASPTHRALLVEDDWTAYGWGFAWRNQTLIVVARFWHP